MNFESPTYPLPTKSAAKSSARPANEIAPKKLITYGIS
ncbi:MAG: CRISPR-associated protein Cas5 [Candidatus Njordarchaeum guaymaensis]